MLILAWNEANDGNRIAGRFLAKDRGIAKNDSTGSRPARGSSECIARTQLATDRRLIGKIAIWVVHYIQLVLGEEEERLDVEVQAWLGGDEIGSAEIDVVDHA